jgi:hypothetical protein
MRPMSKIIIDSEFKSLVPPLLSHEFDQLEANIKQDGCHEPLSVWKNGKGSILLDGHNRFKICGKHNIPFKTVTLNFNSREDAKLWIGERQLGRRNLSDDQRAIVANELYEIRAAMAVAEKLKHARDVKKNGNGSIEAKPTSEERTRKKLAKEANLSERSIRLAAQIKKRARKSRSL